jgi:hypothetical protein
MIQKVIFNIKAYTKLRQYVCKVNTEISGLGIIEKDKGKGILTVKDIWLLPQKCTAATTEISKDGMAKFYDKMISEGKDTSLIKLWWHSHCDMPVFWSPTDTGTVEDFDTEQPQENWFLSIVTNKEAKIKCRLDIFDPVRITLDNLPWEVDFSDPETDKEVTDDMTTNYEEIIEPIDDILDDIDLINNEDYWFRKNGIPIPMREII